MVPTFLDSRRENCWHMSENKSASANEAPQQFGNVLLAGKDQHRDERAGLLRMHIGGFGWKSQKSGNVMAIPKTDLRSVEWTKVPQSYQLKLRAKGGFAYKFVGLRKQDRKTIAEYCKTHFSIELTETVISVCGWNWGDTAVDGNSLHFSVDDRQAFDFTLSDVSQAREHFRRCSHLLTPVTWSIFGVGV